MAAAYALALQALLGSVLMSEAATHADPFAICFASDDGTPADHGTGKSHVHDECALCTLAKGSHAILGVPPSTTTPALVYSAVRISRTIERIVQYDSPTGQYQTGPPPSARAG